jgi:hypothetical protein
MHRGEVMVVSRLTVKLVHFARTWLPIVITVLIATAGVALLLVYHLYRVSGLDVTQAIADLSQLFTMENILIGVFMLLLGVGFSVFFSRRK